ncbi:MAG: FAD-dependent oxidoreductase [Verrucomicrobia bacterium]|nr:FAD-dependent oxidoreductase [Verrucomicrobiota bacterium]
MREIEYLIIGAGPTGLGAATRLEEKKRDWCLLETENHFGGLATSFVDEQGFTWDLGGHVQFSHYETFDRYMKQALGEDGWLTHQRESWVWIRKRFVPYPFQNNLHRLDAQERWAAVEGLLEAHEQEGKTKPGNFEEWMLATFGRGITELFMHPYNFKVWAYPPHTMAYNWIGERVAVPKLGGVLKSVCTGLDEVSWGPNAVFQFPKYGGTGAIWKSIGEKLPADKVKLGMPVERIDPQAKKVITAGGEEIAYRYLINTIPLNKLIEMTSGVVEEEVAGKLVFSGTNVVGVGLEGQPPQHLEKKCWMYFPENNSPYYRITVFSNYSPNNCPKPGEQWSLMTETAESPAKPVRHDSLVEETLLALEEDGLIPDPGKIVSVTNRHIEQGYPTPFLGRDNIVDPVLRAFEDVDIYSRGRFGAWKYEVANQDHSFAQGYECVDRLTSGGGAECEPTLHEPGLVNSRRNP